MKLELKHIAPYLLYGLLIQTYRGILTLEEDNSSQSISLWAVIRTQSTSKPILKSLNDLKVGHDDYGEYNWEYPEEFKHDIKTGQASYEDMTMLLSAHYDVFGLIDKGLAVDLKTLTT